MSAVQELREIQVELRQISAELGMLNSEMATHPDKPNPKVGRIEPLALTQWRLTKATYEAKKVPLQARALELQKRKDKISLGLRQEPVSLASLASIIDALTGIEARFTADSAEDAWEALTALIDTLEYEENRLKVEQQVEKLEIAS